MSQPVQDLRDLLEFSPLRHSGSVDHQHGQAQQPRGIKLGARTCAARVLGHYQLRAVALHQRAVIFHRKRTARYNHIAVRQRYSFRCVHQPQQIVMLGLGCKLLQMHATNGQKNALRQAAQGADCCVDIRHVQPVVSLFRDPGRPRQHRQRCRGNSTGFNRVAAHLRGKGMSCVNNMADPMVANIACQPDCTTESSHTRWHRLMAGRVNTTCIGVGRRNALFGDRFCQSIRLGRATKNQEVGHV